MTKKHFIRMAEIVRNIKDGKWQNPETEEPTELGHALLVANAFANVAREDNPRFDEQRFLKACGF